ncbi:hypothetical protein BJY04DRAFT_115662 [Aspergillus karnatakaensis]|uniref:uncharacterized protein n=1 Tax=Aspergillus karnatakaensis TaxID=1810916 RepID=UPI003CCD453B
MAQQFEVAVLGKKRPAEGELDDQPLAKRFDRLQIGSLTALRLPPSRQEIATLVPKLSEQNDAMMLDDTKSRVYVHDLERELAEVERLDSPLIILPGLEDKLSISKRMMVPDSARQCSEMVLYREPESLSIPKERDQVRRAIIETRERARLRQSMNQFGLQECAVQKRKQHVSAGGGEASQISGFLDDKMDIDVDV